MHRTWPSQSFPTPYRGQFEEENEEPEEQTNKDKRKVRLGDVIDTGKKKYVVEAMISHPENDVLVFRVRACDGSQMVQLLKCSAPSRQDFHVNEVRKLQHLNRCKHFLPVISTFQMEFDGTRFDGFVTFYKPNGNLRNAMGQPDSLKLKLVLHIGEAVHEMHQHGIVHDDLKPENLLWDSDGSVWIIDLESAWYLGERPTLVWGTDGYNAPEKVNNPNSRDQRSDLWAEGVILWELFEGEAHSPPGSVTSGQGVWFNNTPQGLRPLITRLLASRQEDRGNTTEMWEDIQEFYRRAEPGGIQ
jgi:serine/threonine protein kinase